MKKTKIFLIAGILISFEMLNSCTNLDEIIYDEIPVDKFGSSTKEINSLIGPIYRTFKTGFPGQSFWPLSEFTSDMAFKPTRKGGDGWEGGLFKSFVQHTWTPDARDVRVSFTNAFASISKCNMIYSTVSESNILNKDQILAEIRGVRAYWYYMLLDYFGNVPIVTDFKDLTLPETKTRKQVYEFVLSELNEIKGIVRSDVTSASYGKVTKGFVYTLLAKMYLNAMVWNPGGGTKWNECINACDTVMSLDYILEPDWKINFAVKNQNSREIIFPCVFSTADGGNSMLSMSLHYLDPIALGIKMSTTNMVCAMPDYVKAYDPDDKRLAWSFLIGPIIDPATGKILITAHGRPLIHTVDVTIKYGIDAEGWGQVEQEDGARNLKWEVEKGLSSSSIENDFAIFRLADVYLMKAESLIRNNADNAEATRLVNEIRKRAFNDPAKLKSSVILDDIYKERRFEFAWEMFCRQDMIRFGTYLDAVPGWRGVTAEKYLLFPIPTTALDANSKLIQNPGY